MFIQSKEGQSYLTANHAELMEALKKYPNIRAVFNDNWAKHFLAKCLCSKGKVESLGFPIFYLASDLINCDVLPKNYLEHAEKGLSFLLEKSKGQNKKDLIGGLRDGRSSHTFEVMLAWALMEKFGKENVEPYPRISNSSRKTIDFAVKYGKKRIFLEAMTIFDDNITNETKLYCISHGYQQMNYNSDEKDENRLFRACIDKVKQREISEPIILCVNQYSNWPNPSSGAEVIGKLVGSAVWDQSLKLVGVAYFYYDNLVSFCIVEKCARSLDVDSAIVNEIYLAIRRIVGQKY